MSFLLRRLSGKRWVSSSAVFPGIEPIRDDEQQYWPAPLRLDRIDREETIDEQSKGSALRLLRDRYVDDDGYLQSRSPFPLKAPRWEEMDNCIPNLLLRRDFFI